MLVSAAIAVLVTGILIHLNSVTSYYMSYIFINALGISELLSRILAACGSVDYLIFACLAYFVIERYGRRKVMMWSAAACSICWICISIALGLSEKGGDSYVLGSVAVAFFFLFFASFGMGVLGVPWLYPTEINALEMRTKGKWSSRDKKIRVFSLQLYPLE